MSMGFLLGCSLPCRKQTLEWDSEGIFRLKAWLIMHAKMHCGAVWRRHSPWMFLGGRFRRHAPCSLKRLLAGRQSDHTPTRRPAQHGGARRFDRRVWGVPVYVSWEPASPFRCGTTWSQLSSASLIPQITFCTGFEYSTLHRGRGYNHALSQNSGQGIQCHNMSQYLFPKGLHAERMCVCTRGGKRGSVEDRQR